MPNAVSGSNIADSAQINPGVIQGSDIANKAITLALMADSTQGDIIYYGASGVVAVLATGTAGQLLKAGGAGANPSWASPTFVALTDAGGAFSGNGLKVVRVNAGATALEYATASKLVEANIFMFRDLNGFVTTSATAVEITEGARFKWTPGNWDSAYSWVWEVDGTDGNANPSRCAVELYDVTNAAILKSVTVGQNITRPQVSTAITMPVAAATLTVRVYNDVSSATVTCFRATLRGS